MSVDRSAVRALHDKALSDVTSVYYLRNLEYHLEHWLYTRQDEDKDTIAQKDERRKAAHARLNTVLAERYNTLLDPDTRNVMVKVLFDEACSLEGVFTQLAFLKTVAVMDVRDAFRARLCKVDTQALRKRIEAVELEFRRLITPTPNSPSYYFN